MPSPYPGLDPHIESSGRWPDFHTDFLVGCREQLNRHLPEHYVANLNERLVLTTEDANEVIRSRVIVPDVAVKRPSNNPVEVNSASRGVATLEPHLLCQHEWIDPMTEVYIQITYVPERRIVTNIELLSPSNKRPGTEDRIAYLANRRELGHHQINLVELDFLAGGERFQMIEPLPQGDCFAFVTREQQRSRCEIYAWTYRDALPTVPIPLRPEEADVALNLAEVFAQTYQRGRYDRTLDYNDIPSFLSPADRVWAGKLIAARSRH